MPQTEPTRTRARTLHRREAIQVGFSSYLGAQTALLPVAAAAKSQSAAKSVLLIFLTGGPSQLETFDMKPDAPAEYRGEFRPIGTTVPGLNICEHLPLTARRAHHLAVIRSMRCSRTLGAHHFATHAILTGNDLIPQGVTSVRSKQDFPCYAAGLNYCRPRTDGIPNGVILPDRVRDGMLGIYSGQTGGILGSKFDPWQIVQDPSRPAKDSEDGLTLPPGLTFTRLGDRLSLLRQFDRQRADIATIAGKGAFEDRQKQAFEVVTSGKLAGALDLNREPDRLRDHYGRHLFGQSLLMARRLLQAGVKIVQANMAVTLVQWDTHVDNCKQLKETLLPPLDRAFAALLDDLSASGLLEETLVILMGEFGRTPRLAGTVAKGVLKEGGRDHWMDCFSAVFAGGGVRGGQVIGASDRIAAYPTTTSFSPSDVGATIYSALGVDPTTEIVDHVGRPMRLNQGTVIRSLFTGEAV